MDAIDYVFEVLHADHNVSTDAPTPWLFREETGVASRSLKEWNLMIGPAGSGATVHMHQSAWNGVVRGLKLWFMFPPHELHFGGNPNRDRPRTMIEWAEETLPELREAGVDA